uniref:Uncharacterized protein n=1 Tax=Panagrolaimus davidi TaxID=227884 RepID=A0A914PBF9_9BILA
MSNRIRFIATADIFRNDYHVIVSVFNGKINFFPFVAQEECGFFEFDEKYFIANLHGLFTSKCKAAVFNILDWEPTKYDNVNDFCQLIRNSLNERNVPCCFINGDYYAASSCLVKANVSAEIGDFVFFLFFIGDVIHVSKLEYTENGYDCKTSNVFEYRRIPPNRIIQQIFGDCNPLKIIVGAPESDHPGMQWLKRNALENMKPKIIDVGNSFALNNQNYLIETEKYLTDHEYVKFHVIPKVQNHFVLGLLFAKNMCFESFDTDDKNLPFEETKIIPRIGVEIMLGYFISDNTSEKLVQLKKITLPSHAHQWHVTLTIDADNFPVYDFQAIRYGRIFELPEYLDKMLQTKIPVIGLYENLSFICVNGKDGKYKFLDAWNDSWGEELVISFAKKEPQFCKNACESLRTKPSYCVYDLMQIMSLPPGTIEKIPRWFFNLSSDSEHPVLLEYDNFGGGKKRESPEFLFSLLIKEHIKAIKDETGENPKELVFCIPNYTGEPKELLENGIQKACKLLEVGCSVIQYERRFT